jgi:hypothetical protein
VPVVDALALTHSINLMDEMHASMGLPVEQFLGRQLPELHK